MIEMEKEQYILLGGIAAVVLIGILSISSSNSGESCSVEVNNTGVNDWKEFELVDVSSCETFSVAELDKPVLVETFAVWCPTCTRQQKEVQKLHQQSNAESVSLDVDPNEDANKVRTHIEENGFNWKYAVASSRLTKKLVDEYGNSIAHPPSAPAVLVCENGTRRLPDGVKPVSKLQEEIQKGC